MGTLWTGSAIHVHVILLWASVASPSQANQATDHQLDLTEVSFASYRHAGDR